MAEDIDLGNGMMLRQLPEGSYTYPKELPTEPSVGELGPNGRSRVNIFASPPPEGTLPVERDGSLKYDPMVLNDPSGTYASDLKEYQTNLDKPISPVTNFFSGPANPERPSYLMEPDLLEAQEGMHLPIGIVQDAGGALVYKDNYELVPIVKRYATLPLAKTPEGYKLAMPKMLDVVSNIMGGVAGAPAKAGQVVLGSGAVRTAAQLAQDAAEAERGLESVRVFGKQPFKLTPVEGNPFEYRGTHTAPQKDVGATLDNVSNIYPADIHGPNGARYYGHGGDDVGMDQKTVSIINQFKNKPNADVTIYRAVPYEKSASEKLNILNEQMRKYMRRNTIPKGEEHLGSKWYDDAVDRRTGLEMAAKVEQKGEPLNINGGDWVTINRDYAKQHGESALRGNYKIISKKVKAKDLATDGNSIYEWGYNPTLLSDTRNQVVGKIGHDLEKGPFYSALERAVSTLPNETMTGEQLWNKIWEPASTKQVGIRDANNKPTGEFKNTDVQARSLLPGVKAEELETLGVEKWMKEQKGPVSKVDLENYIKNNKVELKEVVKGEFNSADLDKAAVKARETGDWAEYDRLLNQAKSNETNNTKHHSYQLPGGENYKEMLLTLPEKSKDFIKLEKEHEIARAAYKKAIKEDAPVEELDRLSDIYNATDAKLKGGPEQYKSSHWDEPNVVAHIRHNDRNIPVPFTDAEKAALAQHEAAAPKFVELKNQQAEVAKEIGKVAKPLEKARREQILIDNAMGRLSNAETAKKLEEYEAFAELKPLQGKLEALRKQEDDLRKSLPTKPEAKTSKSFHVEEVQSDLHQAGRDRGYVGEKEKLQPEFDKIEKKLMDTNDEKMLGQPTVKGVLKDAVEKKIITQEEANTYKRYTDIENQTPVPDLPFKKNWEELAWKRALHEAAVKGYDSLSWTPGEAQALRYQNEVRTKLSSVDWINKNMGKVDAEGNKQILVTPAHGSEIEFTIDKHGEIIKGHPELKGKNLDSVLGKDITKQILEKNEGNVDAKNYVMNSEGMKAAYDKRGVDILNNISKKYGSKVEQRDLPVTKMQIHDLRKNKDNVVPDDIAQSQYKSDWDKLVDKRKELQPLINDIERKLSDTEYLKVQKDWTNVNSRMNDLHNKMVEDTLVRKEKELKGQPIHYLPITPELRARAKQGFNLFSQVPVTVPVSHNPFTSDDKKYKLTPVAHNPFLGQ
jgi:hypothetical protein